ncbi:MAG TPA: 30S ribosome-binding factor RbfA [Polyangiales bacterium]
MATTKKGDGTRAPRVAEALRGELMGMLLAGAIHDPGVQEVVVSSVALTPDLRLAKIYVRLLALDASQARKDGVLRALERAKGFLRRELGQRLKLRFAPELRFYYDESIDRGAEMEALLREIKESDDKPRE